MRLKAGRTHEDAADLTQEFFARLVEKDGLARFDPSKARLRTYLRVLVDGLSANEWKAETRLKRGGGLGALSLDADAVRAEFERSAASAGNSPEDLFEKEWVRSVFSMAVERFRAASLADGKDLRFALFSAYDLEGDAGVERPRYEDLARRHGTTAVDGLTAWFTPEVRSQIVTIVLGSTFKGLVAGILIGLFARKVESVPATLVVGTTLGLLFAYLVANMQGKYYFEIMLPGAIVGLLTGYATQRYGRGPERAAAPRTPAGA